MQFILFGIRWQWISNLLQKPFDENPLAIKFLCWFPFIGRKPRNSSQTFSQIFCVLPVIASPSTGSPRITSTSCNVMVISPCGMWKVWVSGRHRSTKAVIRPWSSSLPGCLKSPSKPNALIMSTTRSSTIGSRLKNSSVRPQQVRAPGSCRKRNPRLTYDKRLHVHCMN